MQPNHYIYWAVRAVLFKSRIENKEMMLRTDRCDSDDADSFIRCFWPRRPSPLHHELRKNDYMKT